MRNKVHCLIILLVLAVFSLGVFIPKTEALYSTEWYIENYYKAYPQYEKYELPAVAAYRDSYNGSLAQAIVGRAMWYMHYGYMVYGNLGYTNNGTIDCSNFVYRVYKDFGYTLTTYASKYVNVGARVPGVYSQLQPGSTSKYMLVGVENLKPADIFLFWSTNSSGQKYVSHVAIYAGIINGKPWIIHTIKGRPTAIGMTNSFTYWYGQHFMEARRVLPDTAYLPGTQTTLPPPVIPASYVLPPQGPVIMPSQLPCGFGLPVHDSNSGNTGTTDPTEPANSDVVIQPGDSGVPDGTGGSSSENTDNEETTVPQDSNPGLEDTTNTADQYVLNYRNAYPAYEQHELAAVASYRADYDGSLARAIVGRAMWYMQHGYMVPGREKYSETGQIFNSNFVYLCFRDFGIKLSPTLKDYTSFGTRVSGVYSQLQPGSTNKYMLVGVENLKPGDIFLYWDKDSSGQKYISHVAIYAGIINGKPWIIHTIKGRPTAIGMTDSFTYWYGQHFLEARRVLPDTAYLPGTQTTLPQPVIPIKYTLTPQSPVIMPGDLPKGF